MTRLILLATIAFILVPFKSIAQQNVFVETTVKLFGEVADGEIKGTISENIQEQIRSLDRTEEYYKGWDFSYVKYAGATFPTDTLPNLWGRVRAKEDSLWRLENEIEAEAERIAYLEKIEATALSSQLTVLKLAQTLNLTMPTSSYDYYILSEVDLHDLGIAATSALSAAQAWSKTANETLRTERENAQNFKSWVEIIDSDLKKKNLLCGTIKSPKPCRKKSTGGFGAGTGSPGTVVR